MNRRGALIGFGALGVTGLAAPGRRAFADCMLIPQETAGPFPLWNDIAGAATVERRAIAGGRQGVPLDLTLTIVHVNEDCSPVRDARVYVWHCDKDGAYSAADDTFCRGVQATDRAGRVTFSTIYPGWYYGRATHVHFRVYLADKLAATSQLAFPDEVTAAVYRTPLYAARGQNARTAARDGVFRDGHEYQLLRLTRAASGDGYAGVLNVGIAA